MHEDMVAISLSPHPVDGYVTTLGSSDTLPFTSSRETMISKISY